jgi:hypothetical protein
MCRFLFTIVLALVLGLGGTAFPQEGEPVYKVLWFLQAGGNERIDAQGTYYVSVVKRTWKRREIEEFLCRFIAREVPKEKEMFNVVVLRDVDDGFVPGVTPTSGKNYVGIYMKGLLGEGSYTFRGKQHAFDHLSDCSRLSGKRP